MTVYNTSSTSRTKSENHPIENTLEKDFMASVDAIAESDTAPVEAPSVATTTIPQADEQARTSSALPQSVGKRAFGIANRMANATTLESLYQVTVTELRKRFQCDRAIIYQFNSQSAGKIVAESLAHGYSPMLGECLPALAFGQSDGNSYKQQPMVAINSTEAFAATPHQKQLFNRFQTKASLSLPVFLGDKIWGLVALQQCSEARTWQRSAISSLYITATELQINLQPLNFQAERQLLTKLSDSIRQGANPETVFKVVTRDLRKLFNVDRIAICQFRQDYSLQFVFESKASHIAPILDTILEDSHLQQHQGGSFRRHQPFVVHQVQQQSNLSECHIENLAEFEIEACAIVAIYQGQKLWGLLGAYQHSGDRYWEDSEIRVLSQVGDLVGVGLYQSELIEETRRAAQAQEALPDIINKLSSASYAENIYQTAVQEVQRLLQAERVCIYKFRPDYFGDFIYESETGQWPTLVGSAWEDTYIQENQGGRFRNTEQPYIVDDVYTAGLSDCHLQTLEHFGVKSFLIVAIRQGGKLWGLLSAFQHSGPRHWLESDVKILKDISRQMETSLKGADYIAQLQAQSTQMTKAAKIGRSVAEIIPQILQKQDIQKAFQITQRAVRHLLKCDRVTIYRFKDDWSHEPISQSNLQKGIQFTSDRDLPAIWPRTDLQETQGGPYRDRESLVINNIYAANHDSLEIDILEEFGIGAYMMVPILKAGQLWGLLGAYQNEKSRSWAEVEINALKHIGLQLGTAIQQDDYLKLVQEQNDKLTETANREKASKEQLQQQVMQLLTAVGPALQGDLTVRAQVTDTEVGTVASAYNNTLQSLQKIVLQVQAAANQVSDTSQLSETSASAVTQQAQQQVKALEQALARVQKMVDSTEAVAADAQQVEAATQQTNQIVQRGDTAMNLTVDGIMAIRSTVAETNQRIKRLSESSQKVSKIVSLISHFTTQTQLLALNASIEATRAGEYGRGFAVVADEVRSLARQSAEAATEIEQFVQEIQTGTAEVSTAMETGIQQVAAGTEMVTAARQNLTAIVEATGQISQLIADITQTTHQQADEFKVVTNTMTEATEIATQTAESSKELANSIQQVLGTAEALQLSTNQFKAQ